MGPLPGGTKSKRLWPSGRQVSRGMVPIGPSRSDGPASPSPTGREAAIGGLPATPRVATGPPTTPWKNLYFRGRLGWRAEPSSTAAADSAPGRQVKRTAQSDPGQGQEDKRLDCGSGERQRLPWTPCGPVRPSTGVDPSVDRRRRRIRGQDGHPCRSARRSGRRRHHDLMLSRRGVGRNRHGGSIAAQRIRAR